VLGFLGFRCFEWLKFQITMVHMKLFLNFKAKTLFSNCNAHNSAKIHIDPSFIIFCNKIMMVPWNLGKVLIFHLSIKGKIILITIDLENPYKPSPCFFISFES